MTTAIGDQNPTMLDAAKRTDPNGAIAMIVETLSKRVPELEDATMIEGNLPTGHRISMRTALPSPTWRMANQGIAGSKSLGDQVDEVCGQLAGRSVVDPDVANLGGNEAAFRASEDASFVAAMGYEVATGIWYHDLSTNPEKFEGLSPRLASSTGLYGGQVLASAATAAFTSGGGDQASAWWVCWGKGGVYLIYPKGSKAGLQHKDMGEQMVSDAAGNRFPAYETVWKWNVGMCVEDYRQVCRVPNIDTGNILDSGVVLLQQLLKGYHQIGNPSMGRCTLYVNRKIAYYLHAQAIFGAVNSTLKYDDGIANGRKVLLFMGCPVRTTDSLLNTESVVS
jgi:hypothetical protein